MPAEPANVDRVGQHEADLRGRARGSEQADLDRRAPKIAESDRALGREVEQLADLPGLGLVNDERASLDPAVAGVGPPVAERGLAVCRPSECACAVTSRTRCAFFLDSVDQDGIVITKRGKPVARLLPIERAPASLIGALASKIAIQGDLESTGVKWKAR